MPESKLAEHWKGVADQWIEWASKPEHDAFWVYREAFVEYLGDGKGQALEIGCGEGRVSRVLKALGYEVTATDAVPAMLEAAIKSDSAHHYMKADAASLPFDSASFDMVMAYNVFMDLDDIHGAMREIRRVLKPGGMLFISIVHPFWDRGSFAGPEGSAVFEIKGSYFGRQQYERVEAYNGLSMHFAGCSMSLQTYMDLLESVGFAIVSLREPVPDRDDTDLLKQWFRVPLFLWIKARPVS